MAIVDWFSSLDEGACWEQFVYLVNYANDQFVTYNYTSDNVDIPNTHWTNIGGNLTAQVKLKANSGYFDTLQIIWLGGFRVLSMRDIAFHMSISNRYGASFMYNGNLASQTNWGSNKAAWTEACRVWRLSFLNGVKLASEPALNTHTETGVYTITSDPVVTIRTISTDLYSNVTNIFYTPAPGSNIDRFGDPSIGQQIFNHRRDCITVYNYNTPAGLDLRAYPGAGITPDQYDGSGALAFPFWMAVQPPITESILALNNLADAVHKKASTVLKLTQHSRGGRLIAGCSVLHESLEPTDGTLNNALYRLGQAMNQEAQRETTRIIQPGGSYITSPAGVVVASNFGKVTL